MQFMGFFVRLKYVKCPVYAGKRHAVSTISITSGSSETVIRGEVEQTEADDMMIELKGEVKILLHLVAEFKELESLGGCK